MSTKGRFEVIESFATHYAKPIDLDNIADEACFSKFHFIKQFKNIYHKTPHQYLISVRIEKAMELLKTGLPFQLSVSSSTQMSDYQ